MFSNWTKSIRKNSLFVMSILYDIFYFQQEYTIHELQNMVNPHISWWLKYVYVFISRTYRPTMNNFFPYVLINLYRDKKKICCSENVGGKCKGGREGIWTPKCSSLFIANNTHFQKNIIHDENEDKVLCKTGNLICFILFCWLLPFYESLCN